MKKAAAFLLIIFFVSACSIVGVHFKLHNPKRAGKFPEKTEARTLLGDQQSKYRTCYDVDVYDLILDFGTDSTRIDQIKGDVGVSSIATVDSDTFQFDAGENLHIDSVYGSAGPDFEMPLKYYRKFSGLFVIFPRIVNSGEQFQVNIIYHGAPPDAKRPPWRGGIVRKKDENDKLWVGIACQFEGASIWWPCKDVVNDEPRNVELTLYVPKGYVGVSNGQLIPNSPGQVRNNQECYYWRVLYPINLYNITFYIGKYKLLHDTYFSKETGDTLQLNHYVLEQHYDKAVEHFKQLKNHLAVYEELFGPYPFYRDGFKLVESPYAGMEHQTAIAYGNEFKNNGYGFDYIILHETAHEWWGNSLTAYDLAEAWIHEGFATYAECLYVEKTKGYQEYLTYLGNYRFTIINRRPLVGPYGQRYFNFRDGDIYTKGAWILHTLRETINNDPVFFDIIKTFSTKYAYKNVTSKDFMAVVNEKTGEDYNWFFNQYLYNRFVPELEYYKDDGVFYYSWNNHYTQGFFPLPVVVKGIYPTGSDTLFPHTYIDTLHCEGDVEPYLQSKMLMKFTENKKLKRQFRKQPPLNANF